MSGIVLCIKYDSGLCKLHYVAYTYTRTNWYKYDHMGQYDLFQMQQKICLYIKIETIRSCNLIFSDISNTVRIYVTKICKSKQQFRYYFDLQLFVKKYKN